MDVLFERSPATTFEKLKQNPSRFLATKAYYHGVGRLAKLTSHSFPIRVVAISDTHNHHAALPPLPDGDILIHAGDLTESGTSREVSSALKWLAKQPHPHKIFIAGNHDRTLNASDEELRILLDDFPSLIYLAESSVALTINSRTIHVYGSPMTPKHGPWPFQYPRDIPESAHWDNIPSKTDILVTHGPPAYHRDNGHGCRALLAELWRVRPRLHVFGHIHEARGVEHVAWSDAQGAYERMSAQEWTWRDFATLQWGAWRKDAVISTLVNAASCGGFRDDQQRGALVVDI